MYIFIRSCFIFSYFYKHILLTLIRLEFIIINIIYNIYFTILINEINLFFIAIFLAIAVCERVLGLSLLIHLVRLSGNDYTNNISIIKC